MGKEVVFVNPKDLVPAGAVCPPGTYLESIEFEVENIEIEGRPAMRGRIRYNCVPLSEIEKRKRLAELAEQMPLEEGSEETESSFW
ncbi:MAG: hypothetical protein DRN78_02940 [Thermoproteota archaeon]|nr:MAG: hypothetical protein DRN78_02940 [Candidatus Korarchaeota archaeon]